VKAVAIVGTAGAAAHYAASAAWPAYKKANFRLKMLVSAVMLVAAFAVRAELGHLERMTHYNELDKARDDAAFEAALARGNAAANAAMSTAAPGAGRAAGERASKGVALA